MWALWRVRAGAIRKASLLLLWMAWPAWRLTVLAVTGLRWLEAAERRAMAMATELHGPTQEQRDMTAAKTQQPR